MAYQCISAFQVDSWGGGHAFLLWDFPTNFKYLLDASGERRQPGFLVSAPHRGREGLQPGDAVMGDPSRFLTLRVSVWHRCSRHPCVQRALRSLPVPRARRGEGLPAVSPQGDAFVFRCCEAFLRVLSCLCWQSWGERSGPTVREQEMNLCCYLQSRHLSVSPVKAGGKETSLAVQWLQLRLPKQGVWARSLIRELRSHMLHSQKKQSIKQKRYCSKFS